MSAFGAVLGLQYLGYYSETSRGTTGQTLRGLQLKLLGAETYHLRDFLEVILPSILQAALALFIAGFLMWIGSLHFLLACVVAPIVAFAFLGLLIITFLGIRDPTCPYRTAVAISLSSYFIERVSRPAAFVTKQGSKLMSILMESGARAAIGCVSIYSRAIGQSSPHPGWAYILLNKATLLRGGVYMVPIIPSSRPADTLDPITSSKSIAYYIRRAESASDMISLMYTLAFTKDKFFAVECGRSETVTKYLQRKALGYRDVPRVVVKDTLNPWANAILKIYIADQWDVVRTSQGDDLSDMVLALITPPAGPLHSWTSNESPQRLESHWKLYLLRPLAQACLAKLATVSVYRFTAFWSHLKQSLDDPYCFVLACHAFYTCATKSTPLPRRHGQHDFWDACIHESGTYAISDASPNRSKSFYDSPEALKQLSYAMGNLSRCLPGPLCPALTDIFTSGQTYIDLLIQSAHPIVPNLCIELLQSCSSMLGWTYDPEGGLATYSYPPQRNTYKVGYRVAFSQSPSQVSSALSEVEEDYQHMAMSDWEAAHPFMMHVLKCLVKVEPTLRKNSVVNELRQFEEVPDVRGVLHTYFRSPEGALMGHLAVLERCTNHKFSDKAAKLIANVTSSLLELLPSAQNLGYDTREIEKEVWRLRILVLEKWVPVLWDPREEKEHLNFLDRARQWLSEEVPKYHRGMLRRFIRDELTRADESAGLPDDTKREALMQVLICLSADEDADEYWEYHQLATIEEQPFHEALPSDTPEFVANEGAMIGEHGPDEDEKGGD